MKAIDDVSKPTIIVAPPNPSEPVVVLIWRRTKIFELLTFVINILPLTSTGAIIEDFVALVPACICVDEKIIMKIIKKRVNSSDVRIPFWRTLLSQ